jgi:2-dehydropantoate 2-reductase
MGLLIAGTGALACLFAARLSSAGNKVTMLGTWPEGLAALRKYGVRLLELDGSSHQYSVEVLDGSAARGNFMQCLVLVKSWQTERVAGQLGKCLSENGVVLTLQNGLGNDEILKAALNPDRVLSGVTTVGARMLEPGYVQCTGSGKVFLGAHPHLGGMPEILQKAGFPVEVVTDPVSLLWGKLVINAAINPLTALLRVTNGELLDRPAARELLAQAAHEAASVARMQGINLPYPDPVLAVEEVARNTSGNYSSMLQDVMRGAVTEIEAINGAIVRMGDHLGVPTPVNRMLWKLVTSMDHAR